MPDHITTDRLILRRPVMADADVIVPLIGDLEVARWLTRVPHPYGLDDAREFLRRVSREGADVRFIEMNGVLVGCIGTVNELGYWLGQNHWGRGYATEAARAMITRHFAQGQTELGSGHFTENSPSRHVQTNLGIVPTSQEQALCPATGDRHVLQRMVLTQTAWEAQT